MKPAFEYWLLKEICDQFRVRDCDCRLCAYWAGRRPGSFGELAVKLFPHGHPELRALIVEFGRRHG